MGFILSFIAYFLFLVLAPLNFIVVMCLHAKKRGFFKVMDSFWFWNAYEIDVFANKHFGDLFNFALRKKQGYKFGKKFETISSALGKNQEKNTLSFTGRILVFILDTLDKDHCKKAIQKEINTRLN